MKREAIERRLPEVVQRALREGEPLWALLGVMEALHAPVERMRGDLDRVFDPRRAPDAFVGYLARWVDLERVFESSASEASPQSAIEHGALRELIARAVELSQWRGTARGLVSFLECATGVSGFEVDEAVVPPGGVEPRPYHIRIRVPEAARAARPLIERIVASEKPAYVTAELAFAGESSAAPSEATGGE